MLVNSWSLWGTSRAFRHVHLNTTDHKRILKNWRIVSRKLSGFFDFARLRTLMKFQGHTEHRSFPTSKLEVSTKRTTLSKGSNCLSEMGKVCSLIHGMPWIDDEDFTVVFVFPHFLKHLPYIRAHKHKSTCKLDNCIVSNMRGIARVRWICEWSTKRPTHIYIVYTDAAKNNSIILNLSISNEIAYSCSFALCKAAARFLFVRYSWTPKKSDFGHSSCPMDFTAVVARTGQHLPHPCHCETVDFANVNFSLRRIDFDCLSLMINH